MVQRQNCRCRDAVSNALMNNRGLAAARHVVGQAHGRLRQAGLLPNPEVEFSGYSDFVSGSEGEGAFVIGLHQWFPLTSRLGLARQVARVDVAMALREVRNRERLLIAEVQKLYARAQAARLGSGFARRVRENIVVPSTLTELRAAISAKDSAAAHSATDALAAFVKAVPSVASGLDETAKQRTTGMANNAARAWGQTTHELGHGDYEKAAREAAKADAAYRLLAARLTP